MISTLYIALCVAYGPANFCEERYSLPIDEWEGAEAPLECEKSRIEAEHQLIMHGRDQLFTVYCETQPSGE